MGTVRKLRLAIKHAEDSKEDISAEYHNREESEGYEIQEQIRIISRSLSASYFSELAWTGDKIGSEYINETLQTLKQARDIFGNHPFHHVIDGRLAEIVQESLKRGLQIPPEFQDDYRYFEINPWNNPHLNYNTPHDCIEHKRFESVPPDWEP